MICCFHLPDFPALAAMQLAASQHLPQESSLAVHDGERIIARSPRLRQSGLTIGESLARARLLFPDAVFQRHDPQLTAAIWSDVILTLYGITPDILPLEPGWALLAPHSRTALHRVNRTLRGQSGIAPGRLAAMIASHRAQEGTVLTVPASEEQSFIAATPIATLALFGFTDVVIDRLGQFGMTTFGRVAGLTRRQLEGQFKEDGTALYRLLHPENDRTPIPPFQPTPSIVETFEFDDPVLEPADMFPVAEELVDRTMRGLQGRLVRIVTVRLHGRGPDGGGSGRAGSGGIALMRRLLPEPTSLNYRVRTAVELLLRKLLRPDAPIDRMTVELGGLTRGEMVQEQLFAERPAIYQTVRSLHERFPGRVLRAVIIDPTAFLPERRYALEAFPTEPPKHPGRPRRKR